MLQQKNRFHGHGSLRYVYKNGDIIRSRVISTKYTKNKFRSESRFSVVISKKVMKSAVGRNRIRRRIYEIIRIRLSEIAQAHDVVVLVFSSEAMTMPYEDLSELVYSQFIEAEILPGKESEQDDNTKS